MKSKRTNLPWWQTATGYQIWPKSFADSNGDGVGDIPGIIDRLNHLQELGIGLLWLSPIYASPMVDDGYDISDYRAINPLFGTQKDVDRLIEEAREKNIRIIMDLVVNHTSDQHAWFLSACESDSTLEHEYYIWRKPASDGGPPSDHRSCFGGSAWNWVPAVGKYYFAYFSKQQPDLNWHNPALRREVYSLMNYWLDQGIAGFRMDVISLIAKDVDAEIYEEAPRLHQYLKEMNEATLKGRDCVTVGESWSVSPETALLYCGRDRGELDMVFQFNHVTAFEDETHGKWKPREFDAATFRRVLFTWQDVMKADGWNALFLSNHDLPRSVSKYGDAERYRVRSAKLLGTVLHLLRGTPFVYQGEEIGMTNSSFSELSQFRDVETLGQYHDQILAGVSYEQFLSGANANGRDNARTPVQWSSGAYAGFTAGKPWINVNTNYEQINVIKDKANPEGVFQHYRQLISCRKELDIVSHGEFVPHAEQHESVIAYTRELDNQRLSVVANLSDTNVHFEVPHGLKVRGNLLSYNMEPREAIGQTLNLAPYEAFAVLGDLA